MKKVCIIVLAIIAIFLVGCSDNYEFSGLAFKEVFETLNEGKDKEGNSYYKVSISADNVFIVVDEDYILEKIDNKNGFYLFVGNPSNNYSRIVINPLLTSIKDNRIKEIYFVNSSKFKEDSRLNKILDKDISRSGLFAFKKGNIDKYTLGLDNDKDTNTGLSKQERDKLIDNYNNVLKK